MFKKIKQLFICLLSISMIIIFSSSNSYASLLLGGDEFEIISEDMLQKDPSGSDRPYFSLVEVMTKLSGIKSDDKKENTFQYIISANNKKDIITFNKKDRKSVV